MQWLSPFNRVGEAIAGVTLLGGEDCPKVIEVNMHRGPSGQRCVALLFSDMHGEVWCADELEARR